MRVLILIATVFASSTAALAQPDFDAFTAELRRAAKADDRHAIAAMIRYPLIVAIGDGLRVPIPDSATFLVRYDDIFTTEVRDAIARATGDVVIQRVDGQFRVTSIVVPPNESAPIPPVAAPAEGKDSCCGKPRRAPNRDSRRPSAHADCGRAAQCSHFRRGPFHCGPPIRGRRLSNRSTSSRQ
jgi:hypothetical protein